MGIEITSIGIKVKSEGITEATEALKKLTVAVSDTEAKIGKLKDLNVKVSAEQNNNTSTILKALTAYQKQVEVLAMNVAKTDAYTAALKNASNQQHTFNNSMKDAHALARGLSGSLGALWLTYGNFIGMAAGVALGGALKGVVTFGKEIEHTLENIRVLGQATTAEINDMREAVVKLGQGAFSPKDVAEAFSVLTLAGLSAKEAMKAVGASLDLAAVGSVSVEKASSTLVQVGTSLGYTAEGFSRVGDVIAKTAAVSMSSVESISGAFKSAASVSELYGASLVDIGVGLAALSNLGIQGTAAGTSLKNFYKDLSSGSEKVTKTFKDMKMTISDLKDSDGYFLPLIEVIRKLDAGLGTLASSSRQDALGMLFGERGVKLGTAALKMFNTVSLEVDALGNKYANKLEEVTDRVNKSYAFATLGAIAMSQTTQNQFKSVTNTLETVFLKAFKEVQPQMSEVARALKSVFNSPEFLNGLKTLAIAVADVTKLLVENLDIIVMVAKAYAAFKVVEFAAGLVTMAQGFSLASVSARAFAISLGPISIAISALAALWLVYKASQDSALNNKAASANLQDYLVGIKEAAKKEQEALQLRKDGYTDLQLAQKAKDASDMESAQLAIKTSESGLEVMRKGLEKQISMMSTLEKARLANRQAGKNDKSTITDAYLESEKAYTTAFARHKAQVDEVTAATKALVMARKENSELADTNAKKSREKETGEATLSTKVNHTAENDSLRAELSRIQGEINSAKRTMRAEEDAAQSKYKQGLIGEIALIQMKQAAEEKEANTVLRLLKEKLAVTLGKENKQAVNQEIDNAVIAKEDAKVEAARKSASLMDEYYHKLADNTLKYEIDALRSKGQYSEAYRLENERKQGDSTRNLISNLMLEQDAAKQTALALALSQQEVANLAGAQSAAVKEASTNFELLAAKASNLFKGIKAETEGQGLGAMFEAAMKASEDYKAMLPSLTAELENLARVAKDGSPVDLTKSEEAIAKFKNLGKEQANLWAGVGGSISGSLEKAFGKSGKALGDMVKIGTAYHLLEKKSGTAQLKMYGDMAGAAQGFFNEGSRGYKVLGAASQVFHAIELAGTLSTLVPKAISAILGQGQGDPYSAFFRMAAMAAIVTGLGVAVSGGGGGGSVPVGFEERQKSQGTGSVLGDASAKSESISKSLEYLSSNSDIALKHSSGMLSALNELKLSMASVAKSLVLTEGIRVGSSFGTEEESTKSFWGHDTSTSITDTGVNISGTIGSLSKGKGLFNQYEDVTRKDDGGWFSGDSTSYSTNVKDLSSDTIKSVTMVFGSVSKSMLEAAKGLGLNGQQLEQQIDSLPISISASLRGLSGSDLESALMATISSALDNASSTILSVALPFQKVGEGLYETAIRMSAGVEQATYALDKLGIQAINYKDIVNTQGDIAAEIVRQSILRSQATGQMINQHKDAYSYDTTTTSQVLNVPGQGYNGMGSSSTRDMYTAVTSTVTTFVAASDTMVEKFSGIAEIMRDMTGSADDLVSTFVKLVDIQKLLVAVGISAEAMNRDLIYGAGGLDTLSSSLKDYQDKYFSEAEKLAANTKEVTAQFSQLGLAVPSSMVAFRKLIETTGTSSVEATKLTGKLLNLAGAFANLHEETQAEADAKKEADKAKEAALKETATMRKLEIELMEALGNAEGALAAKRKDILDALISQASKEVQTRIWVVQDAKKGVELALSNLKKSVAAEKAVIDKAYNDRLKDLQAQSKTAQESVTSLQSVFDMLDGALKTTLPLSRAAGKAVLSSALASSNAGGSLKDFPGLSEAIQAVSSQNDSDYKTKKAAVKDQTMTANMIAALRGNAKGQLDVAQMTLEALNTSIEVLTTTHTEAVARLDASLEYAQAQLDAVNNVNNSVLSLGAAMQAMATAMGVAKDVGLNTAMKSEFDSAGIYHAPTISPLDISSGKVWSELDFGKKFMAAHPAELAAQWLGNPEWMLPKVDGSHATGLDRVPRDNYLARVHEGERIKTATSARSEDDMASEMKGMREDNAAFKTMMETYLFRVVKNTLDTRDYLDRFDTVGPAVRAV